MRAIAIIALVGLLLYPGADVALAATISVRDVQQALHSLGYDPGVVDGKWGKRSIAALKEFQASQGIPLTGEMDAGTLIRLFPPAPAVSNAALPSETVETVPPISNEAVVRSELPPVTTREWPSSKVDDPLLTPTPPVQLPQKQVVAPERTQQESQAKPAAPSLPQRGPSSQTRTQSTSPSSGFVPWTVVGGVVFLLIAWRRGRKIRHAEQRSVAEASSALLMKPSIAKSTQTLSRSQAASAPLRTDNDALADIVELKPAGNSKASPAPTRTTVFPPPAAEGTVRGGWVPAGVSTVVAGITITRGMIYVGSSLPKANRPYEKENCLVDPQLKVGRTGDPYGSTMGYWPSYSELTPEARRSYLEWLAGDRSNPTAPLGFAFLYFYGLERRAMLEGVTSDLPMIVTEVRRLLKIYGSSNSFNRYATELLATIELKSGEPSAHVLARVEPNGFEVPDAIKIALGIRVRDQRPIEAELMLRFALSHPETRVRTPPKRLPELFAELYAAEYQKRFPEGYVLKPGRVKSLTKTYRACSGTFETEVEVFGGAIPDIVHQAEPINTARTIFDKCSDALDDYSRAVGRLPGLTPNLAAAAKLPDQLRRAIATKVADKAFERLEAMAKSGEFTTVADVSSLVGIELGSSPNRAKLREVSSTCAAFNLGVTFDPAFVPKTAVGEEKASVFVVQSTDLREPGGAFRDKQLSTMLGLIVGHADGHFHESERSAILKQVEEAADLSIDEKSRLVAEINLNAADPDRLDDWMKRLKDVSENTRVIVAAELVSIASADGDLHPDEVRKIETIFKKMGLGSNALYHHLHNSAAFVRGDMASEPPPVLTAEAPKATRTRIDISRLQSIRAETRATSNVLADIFSDAEDVLSVTGAPPEPEVDLVSERFDGLERRYGALLSELMVTPSWSKADFDHLVRDAGLMPGAAREAINDWAMDQFDELMLEGEDPITINAYLLPTTPFQNVHVDTESASA